MIRSVLFWIDCLRVFVLSDLEIRVNWLLRNSRRFQLYLRSAQPRISRAIAGTTRRWLGLAIRIESAGLALPEKFVLISNHQSLVDIPFLMLSLPERSLRFVAKRELSRGLPLVSSLLRFGRHAIISRSGGLAETRRALEKLAKLARLSGVCPVVFPEGTRSKDGSLGPFYSAGFRILCDSASLPVLSVAVDGGAALRDLSKLRHGRPRRPVYRIALIGVHDAPEGKAAVHRTLETVRAEIAERLALWRSEGA